MCPSEPNKQGRTLLASSLDAADDKRVAGTRHVLDRSPPGRTFLSLWQCFITLGPLLGGGGGSHTGGQRPPLRHVPTYRAMTGKRPLEYTGGSFCRSVVPSCSPHAELHLDCQTLKD